MNRSQPAISLAVQPAPDPAARAAIIQGLDAYNARHAGSWESVALDVYGIDPADRRVVGVWSAAPRSASSSSTTSTCRSRCAAAATAPRS